MLTRILPLVAMLGAMSACDTGLSTNENDSKSVLKCMRAQPTQDDYTLLTKCAQLGPQKTFRGTWFLGFEESLFRNSYAATPAELDDGLDLYGIVVPIQIEAKLQPIPSGNSSAYQMEFVGRESLVPGLGKKKMLVLDRLISIRRVNRSSNGR